MSGKCFARLGSHRCRPQYAKRAASPNLRGGGKKENLDLISKKIPIKQPKQPSHHEKKNGSFEPSQKTLKV
ncbi:Uncharacterized protein TCM_041407 [Theobroma cacao]|uniref:Uncharacterized protein n=1 Tax=Theobroma cacao TaxID=3641 RepID=A0A061GVA9_THECC|nr:Uncharacterized protein TCM_041407 [Theobroma cacao]